MEGQPPRRPDHGCPPLLSLRRNRPRSFYVVLRTYSIDMPSSRKLIGVLQLFYRMKKDGPALLGLKHPWDH